MGKVRKSNKITTYIFQESENISVALVNNTTCTSLCIISAAGKMN